jgi:2-haloacid dehalogenase
MTITLGFDVYGTLIDTAGIADALTAHVGERAGAFALAWRTKQLEYAFRRELMQRYRDFAVCTRQSLDYVCSQFRAPITETARAELMARYRELPPFADAKPGLARLAAAGHRLHAFSQGRRDDVEALLRHAGIDGHFASVVSLEDIGCFKPRPLAYTHFLEATGSVAADAWVVSGNPFDVLGAVSAGLNGAWVKRSPDAILDPWELAPTLTCEDLPRFADALAARDGRA